MPVDVATLVVKVTPKGVASTKAQLKGLKEEGGKTESSMGKLGKTASIVGGLFMAAASAAAVGAAALFKLGSAAISVGANFQTLQVQLNTVTGSVEAGAAAFEWIKQQALDLPYSVETLTTAFVQLKNMGLDPMDGTLQAIADQTSALGGKQETLSSIVLSLGKAFSKGKIEGEEWNMLLEKGVPVSRLLSEALGVTEGELIDMRSAGELGRKEIKLLLEEMAKENFGASAAQMKTYNGQMSILNDKYRDVLNTLAQAGLLDAATDAVEALVDMLNGLDEQTIELFTTAFVDGMKSILPPLDIVTGALKTMSIGMAGFIEMHASIQFDKVSDDYERLTRVKDELVKKLKLEADIGGRNTREYKRTSKALNEVLKELGPVSDEYLHYAEVQRDAVDVIDLLVNGVDDTTAAMEDNAAATEGSAEATAAHEKRPI